MSPYQFTMIAQDNEFRLAANAPLTDVPPGGSKSYSLTVFLGPKLQAQLATTGPDLQRVTDFGRLFFIAQPLFKALSWVHSVTGNWGVAIIIVTLLLKLIFYPLSEASGKSMAKMRALQPRIKNIQEQYKGDKEKLGRATMELYQREKVNPVSGCLPMVIQIPVFFAFYWVLIESVEMRQAPFALWLNDLSSPDPYFILPVLMAGGDVPAAAAQSHLTRPGAGEGDDVHADGDVSTVRVPAFGPGAVLRDEHGPGRAAAVEHQPADHGRVGAQDLGASTVQLQ